MLVWESGALGTGGLGSGGGVWDWESGEMNWQRQPGCLAAMKVGEGAAHLIRILW